LVPSLLGVVPHIPCASQVASRQGFVGVPQSAAVVQPTHTPLPSHLSAPPPSAFTPQAVLTGSSVWTRLPAEQLSWVRAWPSSSRPSWSFPVGVPPLPLHSTFLQSPIVCEETAVPCAVLAKPHTPAPLQLRGLHSVSTPGHWLAAVQPTHWPEPLQNW